VSKRKRKATTSITLVIAKGEINGKSIVPLNYRRTEFDDGTIEEVGARPPGTKPTSSIGDILSAAFDDIGAAAVPANIETAKVQK